MSKLTILEFPDSRLRKVASNVALFDNELRSIVDDMFDTMYAASGIGLAATQVDIHKRIITIDISPNNNQPIILINPSFVVIDVNLEKMPEGCLSVPGFKEEVSRPTHIKVTAQDIEGEYLNFEATELLAVCIQHEIDHLNGKLYIDYLSSLKRSRIKSKLQKANKQ